MYVCNCKGLNETRVRGAIRSGVRHVSKVFQACGETPQCARCVHRIVVLIQEEHAAQLCHPWPDAPNNEDERLEA